MINASEALEDTTTASVNLSKTKYDSTSSFLQSDKSYSKNYVPKEEFFNTQKGASSEEVLEKYKENSIFS